LAQQNYVIVGRKSGRKLLSATAHPKVPGLAPTVSLNFFIFDGWAAQHPIHFF
jgi:hypothetical protein